MGQIKTRRTGRERETMGMARHECVSWPASAHLQYGQPADMPIDIQRGGKLAN
jgi:hypothetical protein